jgi:hypothetical protein
MTFTQYLAPNITEFNISIFLNLTGQFYLSVFAGFSGVTTANLFTVNPSFIGNLVSRPPSPVQSASLNLMGNNLWLQWSNT